MYAEERVSYPNFTLPPSRLDLEGDKACQQQEVLMDQNRLKKLIYLRGIQPCGYTVMTGGFDGTLPIDVPTVRVGNAFVRALREEAAKRPDLFPPTAGIMDVWPKL